MLDSLFIPICIFQKAMSQTDQIITLDKFDEKKIQGIVATSVAEEGIDIPDCDLVILYNYIGNEISYKQAMGKTVNELFFLKVELVIVSANTKLWTFSITKNSFLKIIEHLNSTVIYYLILMANYA